MKESELQTIRAEAEHKATFAHVEKLLLEIYKLKSEIRALKHEMLVERQTYWASSSLRKDED